LFVVLDYKQGRYLRRRKEIKNRGIYQKEQSWARADKDRKSCVETLFIKNYRQKKIECVVH